MVQRALTALAVSLALAAPAASLAAQDAAPPLRQTTVLDSLARVRVTQNFLAPTALVGQLAGADTADLVVQRGAERLIVPLAYVRRVEMSTARRSSGAGALRGAIFGFLGGATATGLFVLASRASGSTCTSCVWDPATGLVILGLPLTGATTITGAVVGSQRPGDYWMRISLPITLRERS